MPTVTLTDVAKLRLSTISFFLMLYMGCSFVIYRIWNALQVDFPQIPRLSFRRALGLIFLLGMAFHLILVMISGTRELMTPEAWEKAGIVHTTAPDMFRQFQRSREYKLTILRDALWEFAEHHQGLFPENQFIPEISKTAWFVSTGDLVYVYIGGLSLTSPRSLLAYEPDSFGQYRMALFTDGKVEYLSIQEIQRIMKEEQS
jgi:hypothetical protein